MCRGVKGKKEKKRINEARTLMNAKEEALNSHPCFPLLKALLKRIYTFMTQASVSSSLAMGTSVLSLSSRHNKS